MAVSSANSRYDICPVVYSLDLLGRKWRLPILCELDKHGVMRYNELKRRISGITNMMLTQTLRELEANHLLSRTQYNEIPPRVEYALTETARQLMPALYRLASWGAGQLASAGVESGCGGACRHSLAALPDPVIPRDPRLADPLHSWDEGYEEIWLKLHNDPRLQSMNGLALMQEFFCRAITVLTLDDKDYTRMTYLMMFGLNRMRFVEQERPYYRILHALLARARADGSVRCPLPDDEIVQMIASFSSGLIMKWELAQGCWELVERNRAAIDWFFAQLGRS